MATIVSKVAAALSAIEDDLAPDITSSEININAALTFNGMPAIGLGSLTLQAGNVPTAAGSVYYNAGEFFAIDATGIVQLTSGGGINVASVKGIGGDYGKPGNSALVSYNNASGEYSFLSGTGAALGGLVANYLTVETLSTGFGARLHPGTSAAALLDLFLPSALPSGTSHLYMDNSGHMLFQNPSLTLIIPASAGFGTGGAIVSGGAHVDSSVANSDWNFPIILPVGSVITGYKVYLNKVTAATNTLTSKLFFVVGGTTGAGTGTTGATNAGASPGSITLSETSLGTTMVVGSLYWVNLSWGASTGDHISSCEITYTAGF